MNLHQRFLTVVVLTLPFTALAHAAGREKTAANGRDAATTFTLTSSTRVPNKVLAAGSYSIKVLDHLADRMILEIDRNGRAESTFLALPSTKLGDEKGPVSLSAVGGGKSALRGFVFGNGLHAEFVYPKGEAVDLAKASGATIPAIDPASQGMSENPSLSKTDREMVTLWMLTPTPVGPDATGPGIKAERYQQVASASAPPRPRSKPLVAALPHTAGVTPLLCWMGLLSLAGGAVLSVRRTARAC